ncbi:MULTISPECIES: hypothetical protein [Methylococcus]|uniref:Uncharacterized protein n=1 Tax=Methylococcus capsulatus TaxID=414 RepID=A0ABZ2F2W5_METCP|nr:MULTISPECIES: hypothetical protein [Methylococcus]MDF9391664.1 hypothetical protein [Methylococcus capsulatus]
MSNENNSEGSAKANILDTLKANPKALYAIGGAVVVILLALAMGGGGSGEVQVKTAVQVGQTVVVSNPNVGDSQLTAAPGLMNVASGEEENDEQKICVVKSGTRATVEEESIVGALPFVKLKILDGACEGKSGWTSKVNVSAN